MKRLFTPIILTLCSLPGFCPLLSAREATNKPNVVLVFLDDAGYADVAHTGNPTIRTPHISRMQDEGLNFTQFYAQPACTASRYALLTGRNPRRSGLGTWVLSPGAAKYIHTNEVTIAEGLKAQGYTTAMFGKWHLGDNNDTNSLPLAHGFDYFHGTTVSHDYDTGGELLDGPNTNAPQHVVPGYQVLETSPVLQTDPTLTEQYTAGTVAYIQAHKDNPFFVYLAFNMPHLPLSPSATMAGTTPAGKLGDVMEEIDQSMGRIVSTLQANGIATNTLLIFTSDNGPWIRFYFDTGTVKYGDARLDPGYAGPFRDGKGSTWEGGVREIGFMWWPGVIAPGGVQRQGASTMDVLPTVFGLAGEPVPTDRTLDGRDLRNYLNPTLWTNPVPEFTYIYAGGVNFSTIYGVRKGSWKLHTAIYSQTGNNYGYTASWNNPLLFQVEHDPGERWNQAASQTAKVAELKAVISAFTNSVATEQTFWGPP